MHVSRHLADYIETSRRSEPGAEAREAALRCILDLLSAVVVGFVSQGTTATRRAASSVFGAGHSPIWFAGESASITGAAWANSAAASALDLDDGNRLARGHPGAAVIPAALAAADEVGATFDDVIKAIVAGYQVGISVGASRSFYASSGMWCGLGVTAAFAVLRKMPVENTAHALAIAGMTAPNLMHTAGGTRYPLEGNDVKEGIPWATVSGMAAAQLAGNGFAGPRDIFDHEPYYAKDDILARVEGPPLICNTYFKLYSCCRHIHAPVDALRALMTAHELAPERIDSVDVYTYEGSLRITNRTRPANLGDVQFSIPYCLGLAATRGPSALLPLSDDSLGRDDASAFADKVSLHLDPAIDGKFPAQSLTRVAITSGGRRYESPVMAPRGEASDPLSWVELEQKFTVATRKFMSTASQDKLLSAINSLKNGDLAPLQSALSQKLLAS